MIQEIEFETLKSQSLQSKIDNEDHELFLAEFGLTKERVKEIVENTSDMTDLPPGTYKFKKGKSKIDRTGIFATADIYPFEIVCAARINGKRTIVGRYTNHSKNPNAKMIRGSNDDMIIMATKKIHGSRGGQDGEEITVDYRQSLSLNLEILRDITKINLQEIQRIGLLKKEEIKRFLSSVETQMLKMPQCELPIKHYFSKGVYGREMTQSANSFVMGKIHKHSTMNVLSKGELSILSVDGIVRIKAPYTFVSSPGAKRLIYAHEESVFSNFHATEETDIEKIEEQFISKTYEEVVALNTNLKEIKE